MTMPLKSQNSYLKPKLLGVLTLLLLAAQSLYSQAIPISHTKGKNEDLQTLNGRLLKLSQKGEYGEATEIAKKIVKLLQNTVGEQHPDYAKILCKLAELYFYQGQYDSSKSFNIQALEIRRKTLGEKHPDYAISLSNMAELYLYLGEYQKAESYNIEALDIRKKALGDEHPDYATSLSNLAELYLYLEQYPKAESYNTQALAIRKKILGEEHPDYATSLNNLAELYTNQGKFSEAKSYYIQALAIRKKVQGKNHPNYATSLNNLGVLYYNQGLFNEAKPYLSQALNIRKKTLGENHNDYAESLNSMALLLEDQGKYTKAESYYMQALSITKKALGDQHPEYAICLNNLAAFRRNKGDYDGAERDFTNSLYIRKKALGENHPAYATSLNSLALLLEDRGKYDKVESYYIQALSIIKKVFGEEHIDYATYLDNLAGFYRNRGDYSKAESYQIKSLDIKKKVLGEEHPSYAISLDNLAALFEDLGQYNKAESYYLQSLTITRKVLGEKHPSYATSLNNLGYLYATQKEYKKAESYYIQAADIRKRTLGENHLDYAFSLNNLGVLYDDIELYDKSEIYHKKAMNIIKRNLGEEHPSFATSINNLASIYSNQEEKYSKAESLYLKALAITKKILGEEHPDYAVSLGNLAYIYRKQKKYEEAEPLFTKSILIRKNILLDFLEIADQVQQDAYIKKNKYIFESSQSIGLLAKTQASARTAYESALLMKGIQLQNTTQLLNYVRQSKDTLLLVQHEQWLALKRSINTQNNQPIAKRVGVVVMQEQADSLYKIMARRSVAFRNFKAAFQITPQAIQQQLKPQEAAIEFVHFQYHNGKSLTDSTYYAALVLRKGWAAPRMVYLCEQRALDSLLNLKGKEERNSQYVERIYGYSNRGIEIDKEKPLRSLYTLLWQPIDSLLSGVTTVYYSPSGLLNRLNMAAISTPTIRQRLLDKYAQLVQLRSTREIVMPQEPVTYTQQALLMGGIEYNVDSLVYRGANTPYLKNRGENIFQFPKLGAADTEIIAVQTLMQSQQWQADTLKGLQASEEAFQVYANKKPRVIHLATHGFFLEDTLTRRERDKNLKFDNEPTLLTSNDPMQRSGLVLAGGNHAWQASLSNQADGLLTASEIGTMVLNNTELAVLSACETGLGDVKGEEGVFGLQRAFKMAGVRYLLMSLWRVNDEITNLFMQQFYGNWLTNKTSIREAYEITIKQFRKTNPEPYNWAAFVLLE